jgi:serine/threonine-protein kinase
MTKLADLGIATASDGTRITRSGIVLGTAAYMAPEQLDGREIGPPADIYALAAIAFEALSGRKPREGRTPMEIAHRMANEGPPDLSKAWPRAPKAAVDVLKRGMAFDPEDRPASAGELARELAEALDTETETAPAGRTRPTRLLGRRRSRGAAAGAAGAAAAGAAAGPAAAAQPAAAAKPPPQSAPPRASTADDTNGGPVTPTAAPAVRSSRSRGRRPGMLALILAIAFIALAAAAIVGAISGGDDNSSSQGAKPTPAAPKNTDTAKKKEPAKKKQSEPKQEEPAAAAPAAPAQEEQKSYDPARGAALNSQGFALMNRGDYDGAIPILQQAVDSFPPGTSDLNYAYALFNLGKSLRLAGRADEAVPILEQRLKIPNQTETVQHELDLAKQQAGQG